MRKICRIIVLIAFLTNCNQQTQNNEEETNTTKFNQDLAEELNKMAEVDQIAASIPREEYSDWPKERWNEFKDSVFITHKRRIEQILEKHGFAGFDLVGEEGSHNFWLMAQHSDHDPDFQNEVLEKMKLEIEKQNASPSLYGLLLDRVRINTGRKQVYGTQLDYNTETAQAFPKNLEDSINVNKRRQAIGLEPLEEYLNEMTSLHYEMNKVHYQDKGINEPKLYKIDE